MSSKNRPDWVIRYAEVGLSRDWADKAIEKHSGDLIDEISSRLSPVRYADIDLQNIEDASLDTFPTPPKDFTFSEVALAVFDFLSAFSRSLPETDKELYQMYRSIQSDSNLHVDVEFPEFYRFCRQIQYNNIKKLTQYQSLQNIYEKYITAETPSVGSEWTVEFKDEQYEILVQGESQSVEEDLAPPDIYGQIIEAPDNGSFEIGEFVTIPPNCFVEKV